MQTRRNLLKWLPGIGVAAVVPAMAATPKSPPKFDLEKMVGYAACEWPDLEYFENHPKSNHPVYPFILGARCMCPRCGRERLVPFEYFELVLSDDPTPVLTDELYNKLRAETEAKWAK
jgi:hypothetical protein